MTEQDHAENWQGLIEGCNCDGCREYISWCNASERERQEVTGLPAPKRKEPNELTKILLDIARLANG